MTLLQIINQWIKTIHANNPDIIIDRPFCQDRYFEMRQTLDCIVKDNLDNIDSLIMLNVAWLLIIRDELIKGNFISDNDSIPAAELIV